MREKLKQYLAAEMAGPMPVGSNAVASEGISRLKRLLTPSDDQVDPTMMGTEDLPEAAEPMTLANTPQAMPPRPPAAPAVNTAVNTPAISAAPAPMSNTPPAMPQSGQYGDAARQQLYAELAKKRSANAGWSAVAGLGDMARRMAGASPTGFQEKFQTRNDAEDKTARDEFESGRKGTREEMADYLKQKMDTRDFAFKEKEAGLKHEEVKAAREANAIARAAMANDKAAKNKEAIDLKQDKMIQRHAENLDKDGTVQLLNSYNQLAPQFQSGQDVPGIGFLDSMAPGWALSDQGQGNRERLNQMANVFLKLRSGAAVTDPEYRRFLNETIAGQVPTERATRRWMEHMGKDMQMAIALKESGLTPEMNTEYKTRPGAITSDQVYGSQPQAAPQQSAPQWEGDKEARYQAYKRQHGIR